MPWAPQKTIAGLPVTRKGDLALKCE